MSKDEPQSYGSQKDWVVGNTGGKVNDPKAAPPATHEAFYDERRDSESSGEHQGGQVSPVQAADSAQPVGRANDETATLPGVSVARGGARRGGFFKNRDYKS